MKSLFILLTLFVSTVAYADCSIFNEKEEIIFTTLQPEANCAFKRKLNKNTFRSCLRSANQYGNDAAAIVGYMLERGNGTEVSLDKAIRWYKRGARDKNNYARYNLAVMYFNGHGVEKNYESAFELFNKSRLYEASYALSKLYRKGVGVKQDYKKMLSLLKNASRNEHILAMNDLGNAYYYGCVVEKDFNKAIEWYSWSAGKGLIEAQLNTAQAYWHADINNQDYDKAISWYKKAADQGNEEAQEKLKLVTAENEAQYAWSKNKKVSSKRTSRIDGAFGLKFGEKYKKNIGSSKGDNLDIPISPPKKIRQFKKYFASTTPITKSIYKILATSRDGDPNKFEAIAQALERKYGKPKFTQKGRYVVHRKYAFVKKSRSVLLEIDLRYGDMVITYKDKNLEKISKQEEKKLYERNLKKKYKVEGGSL
ncbi:MAG: tetratricopeptide repeat protein [Candidatus Scalindua sp.]